MTYAHQVKSWVRQGMCEACSINAVAQSHGADYRDVENAYEASKE